jgi:hypothetical protein
VAVYRLTEELVGQFAESLSVYSIYDGLAGWMRNTA